MKLNRTENAKRNILFGFINKIITLLLPFIIRMVLIKQLGSQYLGLGSLFSSILQVLNLTELGVSSAIIYSMYKPVAEDDMGTLCAILNFYRKVYYIIALIIFVLGMCFLPFLKYLINGEIPSDINIYLLYLIYLCSSICSYLFFAYKNALILAYQRTDVISNINTIVHIFTYTLQIVVIVSTKNYYLYAIILIIAVILQNISTQITSKALYPEIVCSGNLEKNIKNDIKEKAKGLLVNKLCQTSRNSFDSIFISAFLGLTDTAIYNNYYYIMNAVIALIGVIAPAIVAGVGNSIVTETQQKNYEDMKIINFIYMWIGGWCTVCLLCLYQPFSELIFGKNMLFPFGVVVLFCLYFYVLKMGDIRGVYSDAKGLWWENKCRAIIESIANVLLNYVLGKLYGIYGIVAATLISLFLINFLWGSSIVYKYYFTDIKISGYYLSHLFYALVTLFVCIVSFYICEKLPFIGYFGLFMRCIICITVPNILYFLIYCKFPIYRISTNWLVEKLFKRVIHVKQN